MNTPNGLRQLMAQAASELDIRLTEYEVAALAQQISRKAAQAPVGGRRLSPRLVDTLQALAAGENLPETAARLQVSTDTVKTHRRRLYKQLGAKSGAHAVAIASRRGLLTQIGGAR
jgi:DNA-binding NarL/FixJ family response regulator